MIIGRSELSTMGINFDFQTHSITWLKKYITMKSTTSFSDIPEILFEEHESIEDNELFADEILDRKYMAISAQEVVDSLYHLTAADKKQLLKVLERYQGFFDGTLGKYPTAKSSIELKPGAEPSWIKPYQVPYKIREAFHKEIHHDRRWSNYSNWKLPMGIS